jgi:putative ABC transport system substrate-binding protein
MIRRRQFISLLGGAAAWPAMARAQQVAPPVIGYLAQGTPEGTSDLAAAVRKGLAETGLVEGRDFTSESRWAGGDGDRLPALAIDLVRRRVALIVVLDTVAAARATKAATTEIPIVFTIGADPVQAGLVTSLNNPGGNLTGISTMNLDIGAKWVGLMHELLPAARRFAVLVNIANAEAARSMITGVQEGARTIGVQTEIVFASSAREIDAAFADLGTRSQALLIHPDVLFRGEVSTLAALAVREKLPALFSLTDFPKAGGLMSYGSSFIDAHRQAGVYAARILKGKKPSDLPVQRATKFELVINLKTAKALGLTVPDTLLARADEVIE